METSQSTGPESVPNEVRTLSVGEYREWVHDRVARGVLIKLGTILGVIGFGGFVTLFVIGQYLIDVEVANMGTKLDDSIMQKISSDFKYLDSKTSKAIELEVKSSVGSTLLNLVDMQAQIRDTAGNAVDKEMQQRGGITDVFVQKLRPVALGVQPALASQRSLALQFMTVFAIGQEQLRRDLLGILQDTDPQKDDLRRIALQHYDPAEVIAEDAEAIKAALDQLQRMQRRPMPPEEKKGYIEFLSRFSDHHVQTLLTFAKDRAKDRSSMDAARIATAALAGMEGDQGVMAMIDLAQDPDTDLQALAWQGLEQMKPERRWAEETTSREALQTLWKLVPSRLEARQAFIERVLEDSRGSTPRRTRERRLSLQEFTQQERRENPAHQQIPEIPT
jgi:hypothetical protein